MAATDAPISLSFIGTEGVSDFFLIAEKGYEKGQMKELNIKGKSVGAIDGVKVKIEGQDKKWICKKIVVRIQ